MCLELQNESGKSIKKATANHIDFMVLKLKIVSLCQVKLLSKKYDGDHRNTAIYPYGDCSAYLRLSHLFKVCLRQVLEDCRIPGAIAGLNANAFDGYNPPSPRQGNLRF